MVVLITGGSGFIATNLCLELLKKGHDIISIDINMPKINHPNLIFIKHDVIDFTHVDISWRYKDYFKNKRVEAIYHLACHASPVIYQKDPLHTISTCIKGTMNMCDIARRHNCPILFTSTSEIYGEPLITPQSEEYRGNVNCFGPRSCYDEGKRMAETIMFEFGKIYGVNIKVCRIFNTYGPYLNKNDGRVVSNFINQLLDEKPVTIYGDGTQSRSFCYVDDLVDGLIKLMNSDISGPINLGNPNEISMLELASTISRITSELLIIDYKPLPIDDPTNRCPNIDLAKKLLNWEPKTSLNQGLTKTIEYFSRI